MKFVQKLPVISLKKDEAPCIRLLSYNVQVGINAGKSMDYFTNSWKHFMPHTRRIENLKRLAKLISEYDIVGLQELDSGSFRSGFMNQVEYVAMVAGFECWYDKVNRHIGPIARHSMGVLTKIRPDHISRHDLPGLPGRGTLVVEYGKGKPLAVILTHLALGKKARLRQVDFLCELISEYKNAILMGDLNCVPESEEIRRLKARGNLKDSGVMSPSYPSWEPVQRLDYILVSSGLVIRKSGVLGWTLSDHLPVSMEIEVPESVGNLSGKLRHAA